MRRRNGRRRKRRANTNDRPSTPRHARSLIIYSFMSLHICKLCSNACNTALLCTSKFWRCGRTMTILDEKWSLCAHDSNADTEIARAYTSS